MPIEPLMHKLWKFTWDRNQSHLISERVKTKTLMNVGARFGFKHQDVGYAIQLLKRQNKLVYYTSVGWVAKR